MTTINLTINGKAVAYTARDAEYAALSTVYAARKAEHDAAQPQDNPQPFDVDANAYLARVVGSVCLNGTSDADVQATIARALASWAGTPPPSNTPPVPLEGEALKASLRAYASGKHKAVLESGVTINGVIVSTDTRGCVDMAGAVALAQLVPSHVFDWVCTTGPVQLTAQQVIDLGTAVGLHIQGTYSKYGTVINQINGGTITTTEQIDGAFA